ncbi:hypothetical protein [Streptomyces sp. NBC_01217]|uniref:hypothetical protein n=1 Tax=Streptomyces sp. NBC_01217 TaxID=2903779 RepID=UPI002E10758A|nr:hypothetical protein OG507_01560 [Streptomyces sp. NBC_01217]
MRQTRLAGLRSCRKHRTTVTDPAAAKAPDLVRHDFTAHAVNTEYAGDTAYLSIGGGKICYLAGWTIADHRRAQPVIEAPAPAERTPGSLAGADIHTDHGTQ